MKRPKIVVADDDKDILKVVAAALRQLPMDVEIFTAADGIQALETIESKGADLAILDLKMPGWTDSLFANSCARTFAQPSCRF